MFKRRGSRLGIALFIALTSAAAASNPPVTHIKDFAAVNDHLYRGAEPTPVGIEELGAMGIKVDLDLREPGENTKFEKELVEKLGIKYINVPLGELSAPSHQDMQRILELLLTNDSGPIFVHCRRGKDRTGTVIACYRIQHDGWSNERALQEARQYGMSRIERGMQSFVMHFSPITLPTANPPSK